MEKKTIYISGALTNSNRKELYEKIGETVRELGYEPYIPHMHTDPEKHKNIRVRDVYNIDKKMVENSCLMVAYVGIPSLGVGAELEMANAKGIPIILMYEFTANVSRLVRGIPSVKAQIVYQSVDVALNYLRDNIQKINP